MSKPGTRKRKMPGMEDGWPISWAATSVCSTSAIIFDDEGDEDQFFSGLVLA